MKALYSTHKHIRVFVFGVPEGWQVALFDLQKQEWIDRGCSSNDSLKEAKADALQRAATMIGKHLLNVQWH
jgi:outer membrane protein TolC